jgi:mannose-6-phosphate isomerase-like protein (cupin superfamily)
MTGGTVPSSERDNGAPSDDAEESDAPLTLTNPVTGVAIAALEEAAEYDIRVELDPGGGGPPEHVHPSTEERFVVDEGAVTFGIEGRERAIPPNESVWISPGTPHTFRNDGDEVAVMRGRTLPENERLAEVVATLFGLAHDDELDENGRPGFLQSMAMAESVSGETYFTGVPRQLQDAAGEVFGPLARALGYSATYDRYLEESFWRHRDEGTQATEGRKQ